VTKKEARGDSGRVYTKTFLKQLQRRERGFLTIMDLWII
jgi:hypothetical protein